MAKGGYNKRRIEEKRQAEKVARRRARRRRLITTWAIVIALLAAGLGLALALRGEDAPTFADGSNSPSATGSPTSSGSASPTACTTPSAADKGKKSWSSPPCMTIDTAKTYTATMDTNRGVIKLKLFADKAPQTVNSFVFLARNGFYDGLTFHRVIPDFMIQGGDPEGTGRGGPGYEYGDENPAPFTKPGLLAMANSGPGTNGSQFFITVAEISHLNAPGQCPGPQGCHTVFGEVTEGLEIATAISETPRDPQDRPNEPVVMRSVTITEA